jgi:hypothetical protein
VLPCPIRCPLRSRLLGARHPSGSGPARKFGPGFLAACRDAGTGRLSRGSRNPARRPDRGPRTPGAWVRTSAPVSFTGGDEPSTASARLDRPGRPPPSEPEPTRGVPSASSRRAKCARPSDTTEPGYPLWRG